MKILVIEDEEGIRAYLKLKLKLKGHDVFTYSNGDGAQLYAEELRPDLTISDHDLGEGDKGLHITSNLKKKGFEVIMMSGNEGIRSASWDMGIPFVMKPDIKPLMEMVDELSKEMAM
ncbi:MAG: response regulator [Planctomycetota bacterium]|jgi:DNA-binding response OmpR family regulator